MPSKARLASADFRLAVSGVAAPPRKSSGLAEARSIVNCSPRQTPAAVALGLSVQVFPADPSGKSGDDLRLGPAGHRDDPSVGEFHGAEFVPRAAVRCRARCGFPPRSRAPSRSPGRSCLRGQGRGRRVGLDPDGRPDEARPRKIDIAGERGERRQLDLDPFGGDRRRLARAGQGQRNVGQIGLQVGPNADFRRSAYRDVEPAPFAHLVRYAVAHQARRRRVGQRQRRRAQQGPPRERAPIRLRLSKGAGILFRQLQPDCLLPDSGLQPVCTIAPRPSSPVGPARLGH